MKDGGLTLSKMLLVTGGRDYSNYDFMEGAILAYSPTFIIEGDAKGADSLAGRVADIHCIPYIKVPALWKKGKRAGWERNKLMADIMIKLGDNSEKLVMAFPGGAGTQMMVDIVEKLGLEIKDYRESPEALSCAPFN